MRCTLTCLVISCAFRSLAWSPLEPSRRGAKAPNSNQNNEHVSRRTFVTASIATAGVSLIATSSGCASAEETTAEASESFSSIAERAAAISKSMGEDSNKDKLATSTASTSGDTRTLYDFSLPVAGKQTPFSEIVRKDTESNNPKAILVVNIKQDDPIARKNIPELIALAAKFGRDGSFAVVASPSDQGYYEPDTSALIRLKLASEYGYGINPATVVTDKVNLLGTGAHPFWRWLENTCRTPAGLGRIESNFEKFLVDGVTGKPLRRYPRKYMPYDIEDDIKALLDGKPLPPPRANFKEEWRSAAIAAQADTYRFQKGLNYYDQ